MHLPEVNKAIEQLYFDGALAQRAISIEVHSSDRETVITTWQCNMASMKVTDLKLPTVIRLQVTETGVVTGAELMDNFKGSQGIPCSQVYLNRILKSKIIGYSLADDDSLLHQELMFHCRHIYELMAAVTTFYRYCKTQPGTTHRLFNLTKAFVENDGMRITDHYQLDGSLLETEARLRFRPSDISLQTNGKIGYIRRIAFEAVSQKNGVVFSEKAAEITDSQGSEECVMNMMKLFALPWKALGREIGVRRNFFFSNLVPSSLYGVMIQAIALMVFPNNYNYFQHSLAGLQRNKDRPLCVGMALNIGELKKFFPEFREEDLYA